MPGAFFLKSAVLALCDLAHSSVSSQENDDDADDVFICYVLFETSIRVTDCLLVTSNSTSKQTDRCVHDWTRPRVQRQQLQLECRREKSFSSAAIIRFKLTVRTSEANGKVCIFKLCLILLWPFDCRQFESINWGASHGRWPVLTHSLRHLSLS